MPIKEWDNEHPDIEWFERFEPTANEYIIIMKKRNGQKSLTRRINARYLPKADVLIEYQDYICGILEQMYHSLTMKGEQL